MPVTPHYTWEQTNNEVLLHITLKGVKRDAVDVFISALFVKVNAAATYLLSLDVLHRINVQKSMYYFDEPAIAPPSNRSLKAHDDVPVGSNNFLLLNLKLVKCEGGQTWTSLCVDSAVSADARSQIRARREQSMRDAEEFYNSKLQRRQTQREEEQRRVTSEQWEMEKRQRQLIEDRVAAERADVEAELFAWEDAQQSRKDYARAEVAPAKNETDMGSSHCGDGESPDVPVVVPSSSNESDRSAVTVSRVDEYRNAAQTRTENIGDGARDTNRSINATHTDTCADTAAKHHRHHITAATTTCIDTVNDAKDGDMRENGLGDTTPAPVRSTNTVEVPIDFTPRVLAMPTRARGDEEYYRRSRYKPVSVEDSPMFWKERGDVLYRAKAWKDAADAYSESIQRDGVFLTCVMNRAACHLHRMLFKKAIDDCTLAMTLLSNTPASEITQDRYRYLMCKLHARRGAAHCWAGTARDLRAGVSDLRVAVAYRDLEGDAELTMDLQRAEAMLHAQRHSAPAKSVTFAAHADKSASIASGDSNNNKDANHDNSERSAGELIMNFVDDRAQNENACANGCKQDDDKDSEDEEGEEGARVREIHAMMTKAASCYYRADYEAAVALYRTILQTDPAHTHARANLAAALLYLSRFDEALEQSTRIISSCAEVAEALHQPTAASDENASDSDDEENEEGGENEAGMGGVANSVSGHDGNTDAVKLRRRAASRLIAERSGHVYVLLKAYVRAAAALCGLKQYHKAHGMLEMAVRITPYDNDLLDDCNRLGEKIRMETLIQASTRGR